MIVHGMMHIKCLKNDKNTLEELSIKSSTPWINQNNISNVLGFPVSYEQKCFIN